MCCPGSGQRQRGNDALGRSVEPAEVHVEIVAVSANVDKTFSVRADVRGLGQIGLDGQVASPRGGVNGDQGESFTRGTAALGVCVRGDGRAVRKPVPVVGRSPVQSRISLIFPARETPSSRSLSPLTWERRLILQELGDQER